MTESIWDPLINGILEALFGSPTRAGVSLGIFGPIVAVLLAALGGGVWLAVLVWVVAGLAAGGLIATVRHGRNGLVVALAVPIGWLAILGSLATGSLLANRSPLDALIGLLELVALVLIPNAAGYGAGRWAKDRSASARRRTKP